MMQKLFIHHNVSEDKRVSSRNIYTIINLMAAVLAGGLFYSNYVLGYLDFISCALPGMTAAAALFVHLVKAVRLYIALYGGNITFLQHMKLYCRTAPVSVLLPFKLGEIFRAYCYGWLMQDYLRGLVIILLDRFVDTLALTTMIFIISMISGSGGSLLLYLLAVFLVLVIICYFMFPPICGYWKKYFLRRKASVKRMACLKILVHLNSIYQEIHETVRGRFAILYIISFMAWMIEIGRIVWLKKMLPYEKIMQLVTDYFFSALYTSRSVYLKQFLFTSVLMMLALSFLFQLAGIMQRRGGGKQ